MVQGEHSSIVAEKKLYSQCGLEKFSLENWELTYLNVQL